MLNGVTELVLRFVVSFEYFRWKMVISVFYTLYEFSQPNFGYIFQPTMTHQIICSRQSGTLNTGKKKKVAVTLPLVTLSTRSETHTNANTLTFPHSHTTNATFQPLQTVIIVRGFTVGK